MDNKFAHSSVNYRDGSAGRKCALCVYFKAPDACSKVKPPIKPGGVCDIFKASTGKN